MQTYWPFFLTMDIISGISQGVGAYLANKEAAQATDPTDKQKQTGIILIVIAIAVTALLVFLLFRKN